MGIWDDPWCCLAAKGPTRLPPEPVNWSAAGVQLVIIPGMMATQEWIRFIQTGWSVEEARQRLSDAKILMCRDRDNIRGTCVLRQRDNWWILETLRADVGYGSIIMRGAVRWLWDQTAGLFRLTFLWEISHVGGLVGSIYRGWWRAVRQIRWGWIWRQEGAADCGWCAGGAAVLPWRKRPTLPVILKNAVVVTDSGLKDGCGYVVSFAGGKKIKYINPETFEIEYE